MEDGEDKDSWRGGLKAGCQGAKRSSLAGGRREREGRPHLHAGAGGGEALEGSVARRVTGRNVFGGGCGMGGHCSSSQLGSCPPNPAHGAQSPAARSFVLQPVPLASGPGSWRLTLWPCPRVLPGPTPPTHTPSHSDCTLGSSPSFTCMRHVLPVVLAYLFRTYALKKNNSCGHLHFFFFFGRMAQHAGS